MPTTFTDIQVTSTQIWFPAFAFPAPPTQEHRFISSQVVSQPSSDGTFAETYLVVTWGIPENLNMKVHGNVV